MHNHAGPQKAAVGCELVLCIAPLPTRPWILIQVDDCIAKYEWMKQMTGRMAALKRQGKPMPKSVEELENTVGQWTVDSVFNKEITGLSNKPCSKDRSSFGFCAGNWRGYKQQQQAQPVSSSTPSAGLRNDIKDSTKCTCRSAALRRQVHLLVQAGLSRPATWWTPKGGPALWLAELWAATPSVLLPAKLTRLVVARPKYLGGLQCDTPADFARSLVSYTVFHPQWVAVSETARLSFTVTRSKHLKTMRLGVMFTSRMVPWPCALLCGGLGKMSQEPRWSSLFATGSY